MEGWRFIKSMESLINRQTLSPGFYGRISTAYLVTLLRQKAVNSRGLIFMMFILYFLSFVLSLLSKKLVWQTARHLLGKYFKRLRMYWENTEMERKVSQKICFTTLVLWRGSENIIIGTYWWPKHFFFHSQSQTTGRNVKHRTHAVVSLQYRPKHTRVFNHWVHVNPTSQVCVYSPASPTPAESLGILWPWFSSVTRVHLNYCLCVMQGKNQHAARSGGALWLIVKCCPGAHCQPPLNGLHSRKQSVAVTKGLVGTETVMIDLQWISEDVSENQVGLGLLFFFFTTNVFKWEKVPLNLNVWYHINWKLCLAQHEKVETFSFERKLQP